MENLYKLLLRYEVNIRYLSRCSSINYVSILNYFRRTTIPCYGALAHLIDSAIKMCDQKIAKFSALKEELSLLRDNKDYIEWEEKKDMEEKMKRNRKKSFGKTKFGLSN